MKQETRIGMHVHRNYRLEVRDDGGDGWIVVVHAPPTATATKTTLRNDASNGLGTLLTEARTHVDRLIEGPDDHSKIRL